MVSVVDSGFEPGRVKPKTIYNIGICCFSAKHTALRRKSKDGLANGKPLGYSSISPSRHIAIFFYQSFTAHCHILLSVLHGTLPYSSISSSRPI
jgi:hypothetical protein